VRSGWWKEEERHVLSLKTGKCSELGAEQKVKHNGEANFIVIMMSRISRVAEACMGKEPVCPHHR